ncbi:MAG: hypothetical protein ABSG85_03870 [Spirochaetia bacterium]|jgi:sugar phosphate isomerase/epimerase
MQRLSSDDNRMLAGLGGLDFAPIVDALFDAGYNGSLVREGRLSADPRGDIGRTTAYLREKLGF